MSVNTEMERSCSGFEADITLDKIVINNYKSLLPREYSKLSAYYASKAVTNVPAPEEDTYDSDQELDDDYYGFDEEIEPPCKKSPQATTSKPFCIPCENYVITSKEKSPARRNYENFLESISTNFNQNPERSWGQKEDQGFKSPVIKKGTVVDKEFADAKDVYVFKTPKGDLYSITLCQTDCYSNKNSYFKMQLLKDDNHEIWGRIGTKRGNTFTETFHQMETAVAEFEKDYETLTNNRWRERHFFHPKRGYMFLVEMDYTEFETLICGPDGKLIPAGTQSSLHPQLKSILLKIFDAKNIKKALDGYNFDMERMPMGKLSALQVSKASGLLNQACDYTANHGPGTPKYNREDYEKVITDISNRFYSTLPQSFGHCSPIILSKQGQIDKMRGMIDALMDIQFVCNILNETRKESQESGIDPIDLQYNKLMTKMDVVPSDHEDFKLVVRYINNGIGATHGYKGFQLLDLIRLERYGESAKFRRHFGNRRLLWHGSPVQNFPGILTQGLRIAPPDALQTGHAFGRGVYFADMISKSANYCRVLPISLAKLRFQPGTAAAALAAAQQEATDSENIGFLLLCDVALGNMKEMNYGSSTGIAPNDPLYHSIKGVGETYPDPTGDFIHPEGYSIPLGKCAMNGNINRSGGFLYYNEFIVYDTDQICVRYLCRVKFEHYR